MAFHFTLNGLLRLRQSLEKAELQRLQSIAGAVALVRAEIESIENEISTARRQALDRVAGEGLTGAELHFEAGREDARIALHSQWLKKLAELEQKRKEQMARYIQARTQREIVSNLFQRQFAEYELEQSRRLQQRIDELFLIRGNSIARKAKLPSND
jgi:flagellar export protein FliJ